MATPEHLRLELWRSDAVVVFDWLMFVDREAVPPAEKWAPGSSAGRGVTLSR
jgi:hypothetical protein